MKKTILTFGVFSGIVASVLMGATIPFLHQIGYDKALIVGYTGILLSMLLVYFGIRSYRDQIGGGEITFVKGFGVGICIALISCVFYTLTWEVIYFKFMPDFMDKYAAQQLERARAAGANAQQLAAQSAQLAEFNQKYQNPLFNAMMTLIEPLPVGLLVTLVAAAILRKKRKAVMAAPA